jgi:hypothetical protein
VAGAAQLTRGYLTAMVVVILLALAVAVVSLQMNAQDLIRQGQLTGCERGKVDRADNAKGWETAADVRYKSWLKSGDPIDLEGTIRYDRIAHSLRSRAGRNLDCGEAYPRHSIWELLVP